MSVIVIGAGVDELVAAHYLRRAGKRVLMLDERAADSGDENHVGWVPPWIVRDLALDRHGLAIERDDPWLAASLPQGGRLELWRDVARSAQALRRVSVRDAERWPAFCERMHALARHIESIYAAPPPDPMSRRAGDLAQLMGLALKTRRLGRQGIEDLLRLMPMSIADWLDEWFESDVLKGALGAAGVMNLCQGPRSGGTAFNMLHHHAGSPAGVFRGSRSNVSRVLRGLPGVELRRGAAIKRILVREDRVAGVALESGEEIVASLVVSGAGPCRTLFDLVNVGGLDPELVQSVRNIRARGVAARVTLAVDRPLESSILVIAPSLEYIERAYDDAKYGRVSRAPCLEVRGDGCDAHGRYRLAIDVQYAPYALAEGTWDAATRGALGVAVTRVLAQHASAIAGSVEVISVLSPLDLESRCGFPEGQPYHAELGLDQVLWMRPIPELARYRTPIRGLYLCGPAMHPGGDVAGASGAHAARTVLRDVRAAF